MASDPWSICQWSQNTLSADPPSSQRGLFMVIYNLVRSTPELRASCLRRRLLRLVSSHQRDGHVSGLLMSAAPHTSAGPGQGST